MVYRRTSLDTTFFALADPTRREMLAQISAGERTISELAARFDMSLPAVSKHVYVLQRAGLARIEHRGRVRSATLTPAPMRLALKWIERYRKHWESELDLLARYLEGPSLPEHSSWQASPPPKSLPSKSEKRSRRRAPGSTPPGRRPRN